MTEIKITPAELEKGIKVKAGERTKIIINARELCIVVGAENHYNSYGLKMMFFAPAVRDLLAAKDQYDCYRLIYFADGYNAAEITQVIASLHDVDVTLVAVNSVDELLKELNLISPVCKIQRLHLYSHGLPSIITFNLDAQSDHECRLTKKHIPQINKTVFSSDAIIWSYACRTANSVAAIGASSWAQRAIHFQGDFHIDEDFPSDKDAKPEESFAQALADHTDLTVYAWLTRTLYAKIWNDQGNEAYKRDFIDIPHQGMDGGWKRELKDWIPNSEYEDKDNLVLWNKQGAKNGVIGSDTPSGLTNTPLKFSKQ
jgi:hypothetical protein